MIRLSRARFEELVADALDTIPPVLVGYLDNVVVVVQDLPPAGQDDLLGLYEGIPLDQRDSAYAAVLPDRITVFRLPVLEMCATETQVVHEVRVTVVHEVAHHVGIDDARLDELGYG